MPRSPAIMLSLALLLPAITAFAPAAAPALAASLQGYLYPCQEQKQMCFWHKVVLDPPKGWIEDKSWTQRYKAMVMFPNGDKSRSKPLMYVRAHAGEKDLTIEDYVSGAQERWLKRLTDSTIDPLPDLVRPGKPTIKVYLYKNPSQPDQAFEMTAFLKDVDAAHPEQTYFFQVVLAAPTMPQLDKAKPAFYDVLGRL